MKTTIALLSLLLSNFAYSSACAKYGSNDYAEHIDCLIELSEKGYSPAQILLASHYENGVKTHQDLALAEKWYRKAAERGFADAQLNLGGMLAKQQRYEEAAKWLENAAQQGEKDAQYNLGTLFLNGKGVEKSDSWAIFWWENAAKQGHSAAQNNLGLAYLKGVGVEQDVSKAKYYLDLACNAGHQKACNNLTKLREKGIR